MDFHVTMTVIHKCRVEAESLDEAIKIVGSDPMYCADEDVYERYVKGYEVNQE